MEYKETSLKKDYINGDGDTIIPMSFLTLIFAFFFCIWSFNGCTYTESKQMKLESVTTQNKPYILHKESDGSIHYGDDTKYYNFSYVNPTSHYVIHRSIPSNNTTKFEVEKDTSLPRHTLVIQYNKRSYFSPTKLFSSSVKDIGQTFKYND